MNANDILFYLLASLILGSGLLAVTTRQLFRAAIYLLFSLLGIAGLYFWLQYEFIAAVQIIVYAGGIAVLIIFSIFLTQHAGEKLPLPSMRRQIFSILATLFALAFIYYQISHYAFASQTSASSPTIQQIGEHMLQTSNDGYALPFEVISILLLAAMIASIVIASKHTKEVS